MSLLTLQFLLNYSTAHTYSAAKEEVWQTEGQLQLAAMVAKWVLMEVGGVPDH